MVENSFPAGYAGKFLRVDLSKGALTEERWDSDSLRKWVGGTGIGVKTLFDEVGPGVAWDDPENRLIMSTGPLAGTSIMGTGTVSFVTKGALTGGATTTQANGFMGAYMKFSGFDSVILQGKSDRWVYLYLHDGVAELRDAEHLLGSDTYELKERICEELGKKERQLSVLGIGPAGENLVRLAAIAGDKGHVAGHNGSGAVMGAKRLKAIVAERGKSRFPLADDKALKERGKLFEEEILANPTSRNTYQWGTMNNFPGIEKSGMLPIKNYTTSLFPEAPIFTRPQYQEKWEMKPMPCWACRMKHLHEVTIKDGPYAGFSGEEPEYEQWASWGPMIGNTDPAGALVLSVELDKLGMDTNEASWLFGWVIECYEKGILTKEDTGGLEMTWGNVEAVRAMMGKIARREGIGDLLAEGVKRASEKLGRGSQDLAIYTLKGNSPRGHDHRSRWVEMVDTCVSDTGTIAVGPAWLPQEQGAKANPAMQDPEDVAEQLGKHNGRMMFEDSIGICRFTSRVSMVGLGKAVEAATGWEFTPDEAIAVGRRISNLLRVYNLRCGLTPDLERPSKRYGSVPVDGPVAGKNIMEHWDFMRRTYYDLMGWDFETGKPLPETLKKLGLSDLVSEVWP